MRDRVTDREMWRHKDARREEERMRGPKKGTEEDMMKARGWKQRVTGFLVESHLAKLAGVLAHDAGRGWRCCQIPVSVTEVPTSVPSTEGSVCIPFAPVLTCKK